MEHIDRKPPTSPGIGSHIRVHRIARMLELRLERRHHEAAERELDELDDAIIGTNHHELALLREAADCDEPTDGESPERADSRPPPAA